MLYFSTPSGGRIREAMMAREIGCMTTPRQGNRIPDGALYAADNGKFGKGWPGSEAWISWLARKIDTYGTERCVWATAPDVVCDPIGTLIESLPWLPKIRELGVPAAFVAQDGCENNDLVPWDEFDVLFIGGSTGWKIGPEAEQLCKESIARGKLIHMGRVNSFRRMLIAQRFGCATVDGTFLAYGPEVNLPRVQSWLSALPQAA